VCFVWIMGIVFFSRQSQSFSFVTSHNSHPGIRHHSPGGFCFMRTFVHITILFFLVVVTLQDYNLEYPVCEIFTEFLTKYA
jgi:hypothetical protein